MVIPKILVVYFSRSGNTRTIGQALAKALKCDLEEITEPRSRAGLLGYTRSAMEALLKRPAAIAATHRDVAVYDLVIVGTPVWCSSPSSPVRDYLMARAAKFPDVAFFCSLGGMGSESTFAQMADVIGKKPHACCAITQAEVQAGTYGGALSIFETAIRGMTANAEPARV